MEPRKFGIVDFGESTFTTFCIIRRIYVGLDAMIFVVSGRWRGPFLFMFTHFEGLGGLGGLGVSGAGVDWLIGLVVVRALTDRLTA